MHAILPSMRPQFTEQSERKLYGRIEPSTYFLCIHSEKLVLGKFGHITYIRLRSVSYVLTYTSHIIQETESDDY